MAIISAANQIRSIALFHVTLAAILLKNPAMVSNQGVVLLLSASMELPVPRDFNTPTAATAFLAILFAFFGLSDLTALSLPDEMFDAFWGLQAPMRILFLFGVTGYSYAFKEGGMFAARGGDWRMSTGASLNNSIVFTWGFLELAAWFWVFTTLRDERGQKAQKAAERERMEKDRL